MHIKWLLMLIFGYVRIEVEGYYVERFINICTNKKLLIWNLKREKGVKLYLNIGIKDFKKILSIARKTNCKVKILKKRGIPFLLNKYKKRKIFAICLILIIILIYISSKYVWNIDIKVEENLEITNIAEDLNKAGLKKGVLKKSIDTDSIINKIRLERNDIAWIGIDIKGTNILVSIVKADDSPEIIDNTLNSNIIAKKSGIITKITARNGTAQVKVGDIVQKGDILIAGYMQGKYTDTRYLHSLGDVEAKVWYKKTKKILFKEEMHKTTGNIENKYEININKLKIKLYKNISKFELYETTSKEKNLKIFKNFYLPVCIKKITNEEKIKENKEYSLEEAVNKGVEDLSIEIEQEILNKDNIVNKNVVTEEQIDGVIVTVTYEVLENIGEDKEF